MDKNDKNCQRFATVKMLIFIQEQLLYASLGRFITLFEGIASNNLVRSSDSHSDYYCRQLHAELGISRTILDVITEFRMRSNISC